ncbi:chemokine-like receptor 1 isoform X1 [Anarrhichthys ocellatus]|uniref:chemokine-like receptor 1 isoform X1 n=2 Tax=Anarrhichthys ocellatus TaxID=433405 RepID=UPI0012EEB24D|nr:chemokine-like receptor 1 isoform X1 [Anarrhichthys ocellatus]
MLTDNITTVPAPAPAYQPDGLDGVKKTVQMVVLVLYCVIFMAGTLGNGVVIYVTGCRMKRTVNSVWFLNLALADFLFTAFLIFKIISVSQEQQWQFGQFMCKLFHFVSLVNMFASVFLLTAISLDRCLSIWVVVWAHNKRTVGKAQVICVVIWMTAAVCSTPDATFRQLVLIEEKFYCSYFVTTPFWSLYMFRFVMGFLIPFLVILVSNVAIGVRTGRMQTTRKQRSRRITFAIIVAFFICWLPLHIIYIIELNAQTNPDLWKIVQIGGPLVHSLAFLNSCLNPILYVFMCDEFQKKLKQSICFVLESALAEDHLSFMSSRSLSSHFSRVTRKSDSTAPVERQGTSTSLNSEESKVGITVERERETGSTD